nr:MAG TPA: hypothetical protein [Caudoviricetes sp.]
MFSPPLLPCIVITIQLYYPASYLSTPKSNFFTL